MASVADILRRLGQLHADGFLTDADFTVQKEAFLSASNAGDLTRENMDAADRELGELEKLAELVRSNVLTRDEFDAQKNLLIREKSPEVASVAPPSIEPLSTGAQIRESLDAQKAA